MQPAATAWATRPTDLSPDIPAPYLADFSPRQGYELAEDEVKISLDRFRAEYTNDDGSAKYARPWPRQTVTFQHPPPFYHISYSY